MMTEKKTSPVRPAGMGDANEAARLLHDFNTEFDDPSPGPEFLAKRVAELIQSGDVIVLLAGDGPDGVAVLRLRRALWADGLDDHLEELYVAPDQRGQGMGRALLEKTMEVARHAGSIRIDLGTEETDGGKGSLREFGICQPRPRRSADALLRAIPLTAPIRGVGSA